MDPRHQAEIGAALPALLSRFYASVRPDPVLGPVFDRVSDWGGHIDRLEAFWSSVMLGSGRYKGRPMQTHLDLRAQISPAMWGRWLGLWKTATDAALSPEAAQALQDRAERIAGNLRHALEAEVAPAEPFAPPSRSFTPETRLPS